MIEERYNRSADMRLLELRRKALGITAAKIAPTVVVSTRYSDLDWLPPSTNVDETYVAHGTIINVMVDARPRRGLIPGAQVTVSLSVANDGDAAASNVRVTLPPPIGAEYVAESLLVDGRAGGDAVADEIFANGTMLTDIAAGTRYTLTLKLTVGSGIGDILLSPQLSADSAAILGLRAVRLKRSAIAPLMGPVERPFYESDDDEHADEPLSVRPTIAVVQQPEYPAPLDELPDRPPVAPQALLREPPPDSGVSHFLRAPQAPRAQRLRPEHERVVQTQTTVVAAEPIVPIAPVVAIEPVVAADVVVDYQPRRYKRSPGLCRANCRSRSGCRRRARGSGRADRPRRTQRHRHAACQRRAGRRTGTRCSTETRPGQNHHHQSGHGQAGR